ncbi:unnamed protein product [Lampetra planeri]
MESQPKDGTRLRRRPAVCGSQMDDCGTGLLCERDDADEASKDAGPQPTPSVLYPAGLNRRSLTAALASAATCGRARGDTDVFRTLRLLSTHESNSG